MVEISWGCLTSIGGQALINRLYGCHSRVIDVMGP